MTTNATVQHLSQNQTALASQVTQLSTSLGSLEHLLGQLDDRLSALESSGQPAVNPSLLAAPLRMLSFGPLFAWNGVLDRSSAKVDPLISRTAYLIPEIAPDSEHLNESIILAIMANDDAQTFADLFLRYGIPQTIRAEWLENESFRDAFVQATALHPGSFPLECRVGKISRITITVPFDVSNLWRQSGSVQVTLDINKGHGWLL